MITFKIKGANHIISELQKLEGQMLKDVVWPATVEVGERIRDEAREIAHRYDDPATRNYIPANIEVARKVKDGAELNAAIVDVGILKNGPGGNTFYWWWTTEFGTKNQRARPILRPAVEENFDALFNTFYLTAQYELTKLGFK